MKFLLIAGLLLRVLVKFAVHIAHIWQDLENCTHIAAILFYLEAIARIQAITTICIQQTCQLIIPAYFKRIEYLPIKNIDFTSALGKKRKFIDATEPSTSKCSKTYPATR